MGDVPQNFFFEYEIELNLNFTQPQTIAIGQEIWILPSLARSPKGYALWLVTADLSLQARSRSEILPFAIPRRPSDTSFSKWAVSL